MALKDNDTGHFGRVINNSPDNYSVGTATGGNGTQYATSASTEPTELPTGGSLTQNGGSVCNSGSGVSGMLDFLNDHFGEYAQNVYENVVGGSQNVAENVESVFEQNRPQTLNSGWSVQGNGDEPEANIVLPSATEQQSTSFPLWILVLIPLILLIKKL